MRHLAAIDVGSNTLRLLIAGIAANKILDVFSARRITRLGNREGSTGRLRDENVEASIAALKEFQSDMAKYGVSRVRAVATSALREAPDADSFIRRAFDATGISIEVIPGDEEAELTLKGILLAFPDLECRMSLSPPSAPPTRGIGSRRSALIIDIGGGSTEWILCRHKNNADLGSLPMGVIKLAQDFLKTDPVTEAELHRLNDKIMEVIEELRRKLGGMVPGDTRLIGTGGTFATVASIHLGLASYSRETIHPHRISSSSLEDMGSLLNSLPLDKRRRVKGLEPERADLIIPGVQFTIKLMELLKFNELTISDYGLLEGVLSDLGKDISEARKS